MNLWSYDYTLTKYQDLSNTLEFIHVALYNEDAELLQQGAILILM